MSSSLDPVLSQHFVGPNLCHNCLQRLSAADTTVVGKELRYYKICTKYETFAKVLYIVYIVRRTFPAVVRPKNDMYFKKFIFQTCHLLINPLPHRDAF